MLLDLLDGGMNPFHESCTVGVGGALIEGEKLCDLVCRHHGTVALRVRLGQSLAKVEQQDGINERQLSATQQEWHFEVAGICLARESHLYVSVDNQFEKQLGKTPTDHRFVSYQDRPEFWMPTPVERWPCQQLHQGAPGIQCQLATVAQEQCVGRCLSSIWSLCFGWHCRFVADGPIFRPVHWPAPSKRRSLEFGRYDARRRLQPSLRFHCGRP